MVQIVLVNKKVQTPTTTRFTQTLYTVPNFKAAVIKSLLVSEDLPGSGSTITITLVNSSGIVYLIYFKDYQANRILKATTGMLPVTKRAILENGIISEVIKSTSC